MAKSVKKVTKRTAAQNEKFAETRDKIVKLLRRPNGATIAELNEVGHNASAQAALKLAESRGLKTKSTKADGERTHYFATGTPTEVTRKPAKKAVKKVAKKAKKAAAKRTRKPAAEKPAATVTNGGATA
jgi:hypothetical protein